MEDSKADNRPVIQKRSRLGPNHKRNIASARPKTLPAAIPNGNGLSTSDEKSKTAPAIPSIVEKDKASMSVRNKEICRLHMEETNSINNAQNSDSKADKNDSTSESNKDIGELIIKEEPSDSLSRDTKSSGKTENSDPETGQNGSDVSDFSKESVVVEGENSALSDKSIKPGEENGEPALNVEKSSIEVEDSSNAESVSVETPKESTKAEKLVEKASTKVEAAKLVTEGSSKTEVPQPAQGVTKTEVSKPTQEDSSKTEVRKPAKAEETEVSKPKKEGSVSKSSKEEPTAKVEVKKPVKEVSSKPEASKLKELSVKVEVLKEESAKAEVKKPVRESSSKAEVSKPVKESLTKVEVSKSIRSPPRKAEVSKSVKTPAAKAEVSKSLKEPPVKAETLKPVKESPAKAETSKPVKEVPSRAEAKKSVKEITKSKSSPRHGRDRKKSKEEEAHSSGSEEFHGFDSEHTEKSIKAKQEFIGNSEESEVTSSAVPSTPTATEASQKATPGSNKRMRKNIVDLSNPIFRKPFDFGWKRELVYRATNDDGKRQGDIYYYTPTGKKVRSAREVQEHITHPELSVDNFTFCKEPLGINDSTKEIIRDARIRLSKDFALTPPPKAVPKPKAKATATPVSPSTPKSTPKVVIKTPTPSSGGLKVKFTGIKSGSTSAKSSLSKSKPAKVKKRKSSGGSELEMGMLPPMWSSPEVKSESLSTARSWSPPTVSDSTKAEVDRSCSIYCPLAMGLIPSLQCHACQCLYHPECCGINPARTILQYICKKCQKNWNWKARTLTSNTKSGNSITVSLPAPASTLVSLASPAPPKSMSSLSTSTVTKTAKITNIVGGVTTWLPPSSTIQFSPSNTVRNSKVNTPPVSRSSDTNQMTTPPAQAVVEMNGKRFIVMPKQNVVSVSQPAPISNPSDVNPPAPVPVTAIQCFPRPQLVLPSSAMTNSESLALTPISAPNMVAGGAFLPKSTPGLTPGTFLMSTPSTNPPGVLLVPCLPQQTALGDNVAVQPQYVLVNSAGVGGNLMFANTLVQSSNDKESTGRKRSAEKGDKKGSPALKRVKLENDAESAHVSASSSAAAPVVTTTTPNSMPAQLSQSHYFMMSLAAGYSTLMHIFRYLNLKELLTASRVCRLWHDVASKPHFWQTVRMKNTQVHDWNGFADALIKHETKHLDLRKMLVGTKPEEVKANWLEFYNVIGRVKSLKRIELCRCLSSVIENLAKHVPHLESLTATTIKSPSLNLEPLGAITNLTELRLKGMSGLELTFDHLSNLKSLKLLSITGIKNLDNESSKAIGSLENLETLEIGDCNNIHQVTVTEAIPKLTNLKRLRLEKGQNSVPLIIQLIESASKLPQLETLELINFDVKPGFDQALAKCENIKSLLMIPTYITQSATTNHIVMVGVSRLASTLKHFVWGLTLELLRVTDLFIDQCETAKNSPAQSPNSNGSSAANKKGKGDSIPILKPLIDTLEEGHDIKDPIPLSSSGGPSKVDILPIPKLRKVLSSILPSTDIKILKIPFNQTWRQTLV